LLLSFIIIINVNKEVSYRKLITRQHSCQNFWPGQLAFAVKIFLSYSLITVQRWLLFVIPTCWWPPIGIWVVCDLYKQSGRSQSNYMGV